MFHPIVLNYTEVSPANGQGTNTPFVNPGRTGGLRGRKRDLTEGGIREIGIIEYPPLIKENRAEMHFPMVTYDYLPTVIELLNLTHPENVPIDGQSLVSYFESPQPTRKDPIGWFGTLTLFSGIYM